MPGTSIKVDELDNFTRPTDEKMARYPNVLQILMCGYTGVELAKEKFLNFIAIKLTWRQRNTMHDDETDFL